MAAQASARRQICCLCIELTHIYRHVIVVMNSKGRLIAAIQHARIMRGRLLFAAELKATDAQWQTQIKVQYLG